jgi:Rrf2 family protein
MSQAYLEQMITHLVSGGLARSVRGPKGGIVLTKSEKEINFKEIVELLESATNLVVCLVNAKICPQSRLCAVRDLWC